MRYIFAIFTALLLISNVAFMLSYEDLALGIYDYQSSLASSNSNQIESDSYYRISAATSASDQIESDSYYRSSAATSASDQIESDSYYRSSAATSASGFFTKHRSSTATSASDQIESDSYYRSSDEKTILAEKKSLNTNSDITKKSNCTDAQKCFEDAISPPSIYHLLGGR
jgi:hypothetical protein